MSLLTYRTADIDDINKIVAFHINNFPDYYLTQLGSDLLNKYYYYFINNDNNFCMLAFYEENMVGLSLFVDKFDEQINSFYKQNIISISKSILLNCLKCNKIILEGTKKRIFSLFKNSISVDLPETTLLSLVVDRESRKLGIASNLIMNSEDILISRKIESYYLSVLSDNSGAIEFYKKRGFALIGKDNGLLYLKKEIKGSL